MYRQGHGDCFLLALPREGGGKPVYVLIDCGYKPGSQDFIPHKKPIGEIVEHIGASTGGKLDLVIITHEHQDHVNGIWRKENPPFARFTIEEAWLAWTENRDDPLAEELRKRHKDTLLGLMAARQNLAALRADHDQLAFKRLDTLLGIELGLEDDSTLERELQAIEGNPEKSVNKQGMKLIKDKAAARGGVSYLSPGGQPLMIPGTAVRVFVFGPPHDCDLLDDEDPQGSEAFPDDKPHRFTFRAAAEAAARAAARAAAGAAPGDETSSPFSARYGVSKEKALADPNSFFTKHYGSDSKRADGLGVSIKEARADAGSIFTRHYGRDSKGEDDCEQIEGVPPDAPWRRIDNEWLYSAETLALKLNTGINNTSLVLAFELPKSKKVLFFVGDAQRGNWISWKDLEWQDGDKTITPRDILGRTVLYKVGHHGSHNATLDGTDGDEHPNLSWMGTGAAAGEFTAMITAVTEWALTKNTPGWSHPLPSIKRRLNAKAQGRVFQTDCCPDKPRAVPQETWDVFRARSAFEQLYFDYTVADTWSKTPDAAASGAVSIGGRARATAYRYAAAWRKRRGR